jgi:hypothetical protein
MASNDLSEASVVMTEGWGDQKNHLLLYSEGTDPPGNYAQRITTPIL